MPIREAKLRFDVPAGAGFGYVHRVGRFIAAMGGVVRARINPMTPGVVTVDFDPETTSRERILGAVAAAGIDVRGLAA